MNETTTDERYWVLDDPLPVTIKSSECVGIVDEEHGGVIAYAIDDDAAAELIRKANAAPDLLAKLADLVEELEEWEVPQVDGGGEYGPTTAIGRAKAAIARATGETA